MLTVRIEQSKEGTVAIHARKMVSERVAAYANVPMIPSVHRAIFPCVCAFCRRTFWDSREYSAVCPDRACIRANANADDDDD